MSGALERVIKQTHKTILFEEFNDKSDDEAKSLYSIMNQTLVTGGSITDQTLLRKIDDELTVKSFEDFVKKFAPKVYEYVTDINGKLSFAYTTDTKEANANNYFPVSIVNQPFFQMLESMYSQKGDKGVSNIDFPEDKIKAILTPKKQIEDVYEIRRTLHGLAIDWQKAEDAGQNPRPFVTGIYNCREEILKKFNHNQQRALLALAITEIDKKINTTRDNIKKLESTKDGIAPVLTIGRLGFDEHGALMIVENTSGSDKNALGTSEQLALEERALPRVLALVERDIHESGPKDEFSKALVISAYAPAELTKGNQPMGLPELRNQLDTLEVQKKQYQEVYNQAQDAFIKTLTDVVQKMLSVMVFFDHATARGGKSGELPAGLIVANCRITKFLHDATTKDNFKNLMFHLGHENGFKHVWLGIVPEVTRAAGNASTKDMSIDDLLSGPLHMGRTDKAATLSDDAVDLESARAGMSILGDAGILTVFSFTPDETTSFADLRAEGVEKMEADLADWNNRHAVFAYPSFTVMREGSMSMGNEQERIAIPAVYVPAAYVAAGLIAASQQPRVLESLGLSDRLLAGEVCTRVDLEDEELTHRVHTKFNRELAYKWGDDIVTAISKKSFGFAFCGNQKRDPQTKEEIRHTYLLHARTLAYGDNGQYLPVYRTLTENFVSSYLREIYGEEMDSNSLNEFLTKDAANWENDTQRHANKINLILQKNEKITPLEDSEGKTIGIEISLNNGKVRCKPEIKIKETK